MERLLSDVAKDIVDYVDLEYLHNHILAIDNLSLHSTNQVKQFSSNCRVCRAGTTDFLDFETDF